MKKIIKILFISFLGNSFLMADSVIEKARTYRSKNLNSLVFLETPIANFGSPQQKQKYEDVKFGYSRGLTFFFEDDFLEAYNTFLNVTENMEVLFEELSLNYIERVNSILQEAMRGLVEVNIKYHRNADIINRILQDIEPPVEKPYYDEKEFHFVYDKKTMISNMDMAFYYLATAKRVRLEGTNLDKYLEADKPTPPSFRMKRVENYTKAISLCRQAKLSGLRVYQLIHRNKLIEAQRKYADNPTFYEKRLDPVFDTRLPEAYIVDLNDAKNRLHDKEVRYKINLERYDQKKAREQSAGPPKNK